MRLILTHDQADLDAVASLLAAHKLDPEAHAVLPHKLNRDVQCFLEAYGQGFGFVSFKELPEEPVEQILLVDTQGLVCLKNVSRETRVLVIDHHPLRAGPKPDWQYQFVDTGACTTSFIPALQKQQLKLSKEELTLLLLGIYEDTGSLTYSLTTEKDRQAAEYLQHAGADLQLVQEFINFPLSNEQQALFERAMKSVEVIQKGRLKTALMHADAQSLQNEISTVAHRLRDALNLDGIVLVAATRQGVLIIGRSRCDEVDVASLARQFGGGGHLWAASALVHLKRHPSTEAVLQLLKETLDQVRKKLPTVMHPTKALEEIHSGSNLSSLIQSSIAPARLALLRLLAQQADQAGLSIYIVGGFVRDLLLGRKSPDFDIVIEGDAIRFAQGLTKRFGGTVAKHHAFGTAKWSIKTVKNELCQQLPNCEAVLAKDLPDSVDLITARAERYLKPSALPTVCAGTIDEDLARRDFTINTMAIRLDGGHFGELLDPLNGLFDLQQGIIRVLHPCSFEDDATRILRALRFAVRFDFKLSEGTRRQLNENLFRLLEITPARLRNETNLIFKEANPLLVLEALQKEGVLKAISPSLELGATSRMTMKAWEAAPCNCAAYSDDEEVLLERQAYGYCLWLCTKGPKEIRSACRHIALSSALERMILAAHHLLNILDDLEDRPVSKRVHELDQLDKTAIKAVRCIIQDPHSQEILDNYLEKEQYIRAKSNGNTLIAMGLAPSESFKRILDQLRDARLDGIIQTDAEEAQFLQVLIDQNGKSENN